MDSTGFRQLVKNFTNLTEEECSQVREISAQYPYSQLLRHLYSRTSQDLGNQDQKEALNISAVYATDRSVLKWIMTTPRKERVIPVRQPIGRVKSPQVITTAAVAEGPSEANFPVAAAPALPPLKPISEVSLSGDALREDLYAELKKLQKHKQEFELSFEQFQKSKNDGIAVTTEKIKHTVDPASEPLLEEIKSTKKKIKVDNPKQKEQNEIIDQFIKTQPIIPKAKPTTPSNDLAEDSSMFSDNIVSETLVDILRKQGKKEKAIEVLKKLIWKFPQKKAYFAAQIEELKN